MRSWEERYAAAENIWSGRVNEPLKNLIEDSEHSHLFADRAGKKSLDLGCGEGGDVLWLAEKGYLASGIDISETAVQRAKEEAERRNLAHKTEFFALQLEDWQDSDPQTGNEKYDLITASFLPKRLAPSRAKVLRHALEVLRPGGVLVLISHSFNPAEGKPEGHPKFISVTEELDNLTETGLDIEVVYSDTVTRKSDKNISDTIVLARRH